MSKANAMPIVCSTQSPSAVRTLLHCLSGPCPGLSGFRTAVRTRTVRTARSLQRKFTPKRRFGCRIAVWLRAKVRFRFRNDLSYATKAYFRSGSGNKFARKSAFRDRKWPFVADQTSFRDRKWPFVGDQTPFRDRKWPFVGDQTSFRARPPVHSPGGVNGALRNGGGRSGRPG
jgi:hypothetical protein